MLSTIVLNLRTNRRITDLAKKLSRRFISSNFDRINSMNCMPIIPNFGINPIISDNIDEDFKTISNKTYLLTNFATKPSIKPSIKPMNSIVFPDLLAFRIVDQNKRRITDCESEAKEMPSPSKANQMYCDYRIIRDPRSYTHLTIIRRHKMNKHKRIKWRKKMLAFLKKKFLKRNIRTEKLFRAELLAQIKAAEEFDAEKYVRTILETIDNVPKPETPTQKIEKIRELIRKNRRETNLISPKFDD